MTLPISDRKKEKGQSVEDETIGPLSSNIQSLKVDTPVLIHHTICRMVVFLLNLDF